MSYTVGFDFGTHQTKICIEDSSDRYNKRYSFFKFKDVEGREHYALPSAIQLNKDNTLSYGYFDESNCKVEELPPIDIPAPVCPNRPLLKVIDAPQEPVLPPRPKKQKKGLSFDNQVKYVLFGGYQKAVEEWESACEKLNSEYCSDMELWKAVQCENDLLEANYQKDLQKYNDELIEHQIKSHPVKKIVYRFFKQAAFGDDSMIDSCGGYDPDILSVWYLSYVIFDLEEEYGQNFSIQMGIPSGHKDLTWKKKKAVILLLSAYRLVEEIFHNDKEAFLRTDIDTLLKMTEMVTANVEMEKINYGILVFPEAYASILLMTSRNKTVPGFSLFVDIGGGTTDLSCFSSKDGSPFICYYESIPKGLNWIVSNSIMPEYAKEQYSEVISLSDGRISPGLLKESVDLFYSELKQICKDIMKKQEQEYVKACDGEPDWAMYRDNVVRHRPLVYSGGGSVGLKDLRTICNFDDIHLMNKDYWSDLEIEEVGDMYPILSTSVGLSYSQATDDNIKVSNVAELWSNYANRIRDPKPDSDSPKPRWV